MAFCHCGRDTSVTLFVASVLFGIFWARQGSSKLVKSESSKEIGTPSPNASTSTKSRKSLSNTVKKYDRHILLCGYTNPDVWSKIVENDENSFASKLAEAITSDDVSVKFSVCTKPNSTSEAYDVIVYPENVIFSIRESDLEDFALLIKKKDVLSKEDLDLFATTPISKKKSIFVCVHGQRDQKCGKLGREVLQGIQDSLSVDPQYQEFEVYGTSHLGGHEYAATLVVYPECDWFGYLSGAIVPSFLANLNLGVKAVENYRGKGYN